MTDEEMAYEYAKYEDNGRVSVNDDKFKAFLAGLKSNSEVIADLKKKNAELKDKLKNLASVAEVRLANWQKYEKENKELKKRNGELAGEKASLERWFGEAKEIIKGLLESCFGYNSKTVNHEIKTRAEKFLKEIDK